MNLARHLVGSGSATSAARTSATNECIPAGVNQTEQRIGTSANEHGGCVVAPRTDYTEWKRLLKLAGLRDGRLHDARHTAATVLLLLGVPSRAVVGIMGWSDGSMAMRYQHLTGEIRKDIAKRVGGLLWKSEEEPEQG